MIFLKGVCSADEVRPIDDCTIFRPRSKPRTFPTMAPDASSASASMSSEFVFHPSRAVARFQEFLRINTMQPSPDYKSCSEWLRAQADELGLDYAEYNPSTLGYKPCVVLTWRSKAAGGDAKAKSIMCVFQPPRETTSQLTSPALFPNFAKQIGSTRTQM